MVVSDSIWGCSSGLDCIAYTDVDDDDEMRMVAMDVSLIIENILAFCCLVSLSLAISVLFKI